MILFGVEVLDMVTGRSAYVSLHVAEGDAFQSAREFLINCPMVVRAVIKKRNWTEQELNKLAWSWGYGDAAYNLEQNQGLPSCMVNAYRQGYSAFIEKN